MTEEEFQALFDPAYLAAEASLPLSDVDWSNDAPEDLRRAYNAAREAFVEDLPADVAISPWQAGGGLEAGGSEGLLFAPEGAETAPAKTLIVYFHGGGWMVGSPTTHRLPVAYLAGLSGLPVVSVRYRLAPEHKYPAQRDDCLAAVETLLTGGADGGVAAERAILAGDSAGANNSLLVELAMPAGLRKRLSGIVAIYGAFGKGDGTSRQELGPFCPGMAEEDIARYREALGLPVDAPELDLLSQVTADGTPILIAGAALDPLRDDSKELAKRLTALGRPHDLRIAAGLPHSYLHTVTRVPSAMRELEAMAAWAKARAAD